MTQILNLKNIEGLKNEKQTYAKVSLKEEKNLLKANSFDSFLSK